MRPEEMDRAIETLLKNRANFEIKFEKTNQQIDQTSRRIEETNIRLEAYAGTQTEFIQTVTRHIEA